MEEDTLSKEKMKNLISLSKKILKNNKGQFAKFDSTIQELLENDKDYLNEEEKVVVPGCKN